MSSWSFWPPIWKAKNATWKNEEKWNLCFPNTLEDSKRYPACSDMSIQQWQWYPHAKFDSLSSHNSQTHLPLNTPPKSNIDIKNDGPWTMYVRLQTWLVRVSMLDFRGGTSALDHQQPFQKKTQITRGQKTKTTPFHRQKRSKLESE